ncbi:MAG: polysaccharide deacetylase family protein (PEP-CTERM system associated) [Gammaproteobacteria bacterium]
MLEILEQRVIEAKVFVLGRVLHEEPNLIKEISRRGHEIAFHSVNHTHLTEETPQRFKAEIQQYKQLLEDLTGKVIIGYRAPAFSLTEKSLWALDILAGLNFSYSSSLLPVKNPIFGFPGAPCCPFRWPNGLLEIPAPVASFGPMVFQFLGGFYLPYLPKWFIQRCLERGGSEQCYWVYCHPYDFDPNETFYTMPGTTTLVSLLLWFNRRNTYQKLESIFPLQHTGERGFASLIGAGEFDDAQAYAPQVS